MQLIRPTISRYARNAAQALYPGLRRGVEAAWIPMLGVQGSLIDLSGHGMHGALTNMDPSTAWTNGPLGKALTFDGVDDMVLAGDVRCNPKGLTLYAVVTPAFTVANSGQQAWASIISRNGPVNADPYNIFNLSASGNPAKYTFAISTGAVGSQTTALGVTSLASGRTDHVAATYDGATMRLWVNGKLDKTFSSTLAIGSSDWMSGVVLGGYWPTYLTDNLWKGQIHAAYLYSRALSADEIQRLYADPLAPFRLRETPRPMVFGTTPAGVYDCSCLAGLGLNSLSGGRADFGCSALAGIGMASSDGGALSLPGSSAAGIGLNAGCGALATLVNALAAGIGLNASGAASVSLAANSQAGIGLNGIAGASLSLPASSQAGLGLHAASSVTGSYLASVSAGLGLHAGADSALNDLVIYLCNCAAGIGLHADSSALATFACSLAASLGLSATDAAQAVFIATSQAGLGVSARTNDIRQAVLNAAVYYYFNLLRRS